MRGEYHTDNGELRTDNYVTGIVSRTRVFDRVVNVIAEARINPPPTHALGPSRSPNTSTPSRLPISGSIFNSTPACEAGTCVIPQFHNNVVVAVHNTPLPASASHAFNDTPVTGGIPYRTGTHTISISVPIRQPIRRHHHMRVPLHQFLVDQNPAQRNQQRNHHQQIPRQRRPTLRMRARTQRNQPRSARRSSQRHPPHQSIRSCANNAAPTARITGIVPTISAAWLTVVIDSA